MTVAPPYVADLGISEKKKSSVLVGWIPGGDWHHLSDL
jgi:hypothetical protein